MLPEGYEYKRSHDLLQYDFSSHGPKGEIKKVVIYGYTVDWNGVPFYNLALGNYGMSGRKIMELVRTDNKDTDKILATVGTTIIDFTDNFPNSGILIKGLTMTRMRLFRNKINQYFDQINELFDIHGLTPSNVLIKFEKEHDYLSFFITRKTIKFKP